MALDYLLEERGYTEGGYVLAEIFVRMSGEHRASEVFALQRDVVAWLIVKTEAG